MKKHKIRIEHSVAINFCMEDLGINREPTAVEFCAWAINGKGSRFFERLMTVNDAEYILNNPEKCFGEED